MNKALGYYQDALTACPSSSKAALNLARTELGFPAANLLNEAQISAKDQLVQNIGADCPQILFARERQEADHGPITPSIWGMSV